MPGSDVGVGRVGHADSLTGRDSLDLEQILVSRLSLDVRCGETRR